MTERTDFAFLHGGGQGSWVWDELIDALGTQMGAHGGRWLALDVPGCGKKRDRAGSTLDNRAIARELVEDIRAEGLRDVVLVGHSQAGQVLPFMAALRPELFRRLVYVSCSIPLPGQDVIGMMGSGLHGASEYEVGWPFDRKRIGSREGFRQLFCTEMNPAQAESFVAKLGHDNWPAPTYSFTDWLPAANDAVPVSYVFCLQDNILPMNWQRTFAERFGAQRHISIDAGHQVMNTRPQALAEVLRLEAAITGEAADG